MIHVDEGICKVQGTKVTLMAEVASLLSGLKKDKLFDDTDINEICRLSKMSADEIRQDSAETIASIAAEQLLRELFNK